MDYKFSLLALVCNYVYIRTYSSQTIATNHRNVVPVGQLSFVIFLIFVNICSL